MGDRKGRNYKIEIVRIIACIAVVWYHIRELPFKDNGDLSETAIFFECLCTICVMTFFLITGFFIYDTNGNIFSDWLKLIKKYIVKIFIPFLLISAFTIVFHEFLVSSSSIAECIRDFDLSVIYYSILFSIRKLDVVYLPGTAAHLWYVFSYGTIIIAYPITRFLLKNVPRIATYLILISLTICMVINDYFLFFGNPSYNVVFEFIHKPIYYSAVGQVLYHDILIKYIDDKRDDSESLIINKRLFILSLFAYALTFVLLFFTEVNYNLKTNKGYVYTSWLSLYSLILTSAFVIMIYNLDLERLLNSKLKSIIAYVSSKTFGIYLIHYLYVTKLMSLGVQGSIVKNRPTIFHHFIFYIIYGTFIFLLSLCTIALIEYILKCLCTLFVGGRYAKKK